jgi:RimJ/RimL family protein N-acetyltransferase
VGGVKMFSDFRVYLRALEPDDYQTSIKWRNDDEIWSMIVGQKYYVSEYYEKKWVEDLIINNSQKLTLAICLKESHEHIGYVYLFNIDYKNRVASFGKLIGKKECWGKGYGQEATMLMLYHAFYVLGLIRVEARQLLTNKGSIRVNEKCGFKTEGILRKAIFKDGKHLDLNLMSIIREDFDEILNNYIKKQKINTGGINA